MYVNIGVNWRNVCKYRCKLKKMYVNIGVNWRICM